MSEFLLVDLGSSRLKWQLRAENGVVRDQRQVVWDADAGMPAMPAAQPISVWVSRVGPPEREQMLRTAIRARYGAVPVVSVRPRAQGPAGLHLDYDLQQFGVDRYCALLGVLSRTRSPAVVVDAGTAVTLDLLGAEGRHLGGFILPGLRLGLEAVNRLFSTPLQAQVAETLQMIGAGPAVEPRLEPGHETGPALLQGWLHGLAGAVDRLGQAMAVSEEPSWWFTGGDADQLARFFDRPVNLVPGLVFDGLWCHLRPDCTVESNP